MDMTSEFQLFMEAQIHAIDKSKYIESEKVHKDLSLDNSGNPSEEFYSQWIKLHGPYFRKAWDVSVCRKCVHVKYCNNCLKSNCSDYFEK